MISKVIFLIPQLIILFIFYTSGQNKDNFPEHWLPQNINDNTTEVIEHTFYTIGYNEIHEQSAWVAYELTKEELYKVADRKNNFRADNTVSTKSAELVDYKGTGYDRGHLAPAADMSFSEQAMSESFYLSNMSPQEPEFNRGIWKNLEEQIRYWTYDKQNLYIITGPVLEDNLKTIGPNEISVPDYYYKIALYADTLNNTYSAIAFLLPNKKGEYPLSHYIVSVDSIENLTQMNFFSGISLSIQESFESNVYLSDWEFYAKKQQVKSNKKQVLDVNDNVCRGNTKSGNRCKRKTNDPSGYCWQHISQKND
ncbi:DNA/RNA non-specific endonuclease [Flammeovirga agarivorans]|uniref:Endonuclease n=1 Tax=Flammeovirga agarivorans TaxID=2726742 RepID=A0A7X8SL85_9BACT|nr:DNA/RNA non-specific endonuclease [Flammeovirga agarivorans]NLR92200.1 DNA/RNA non-specific endonuclease [Flammeovirga agarivorans]